MKKTIFTVLSICIISITNGQVGQYEYIQLSRSAWPHISFTENGQATARIQGAGGNFNITSTNGGTNHFSVNTSTGNVGIGISPSSTSRMYINGFTRTTGKLSLISNSSALGDIISLYGDRIDNTAMYGFGIETNGGTLYAKAVSGYNWYLNKNADQGSSATMKLNSSQLEVNGDISLARIHKIKFLENVGGGDRAYIRSTNGEGGDYNSLVFAINAGTESMIIKHNGRIGIGTLDPQSKLSVDGQIRATEVKVLSDISVPDYVFEPDYELRTLQETKEYIATNRHLPEIPSAGEIGANGIDLGDMNMRLLKKIEELTLYQIQLMVEMEAMKKELQELKK